MLKILVVDDHQLLREGLKKILALEEDFEVIGCAENGERALAMLKKSKPDIILMDVNMPKMNGIEATFKIKQLYPGIKIIALTIHEDEEYVFELIRAGVSGYVLKDISADELIETIKRVNKGESIIAPSITGKIINEFSKMHRKAELEKNKGQLTRREKEVLVLLTEGKSNKSIAEELFLSEKTVKNHVSNVLHKLEVDDRTQAVLYALKNGLV